MKKTIEHDPYTSTRERNFKDQEKGSKIIGRIESSFRVQGRVSEGDRGTAELEGIRLVTKVTIVFVEEKESRAACRFSCIVPH